MARSGFTTQAPKQGTFIVSAILWLVGVLSHYGAIHIPGQYGFWALAGGGLLLMLGCLLDGL
ncbi:MAG TPA: hypothetical protein VN783_17495 [Thermoanaerobaculia bacterium]|nr:hypothetical protein [Thermoanaerobaculia bacterium]